MLRFYPLYKQGKQSLWWLAEKCEKTAFLKLVEHATCFQNVSCMRSVVSPTFFSSQRFTAN